jgi:SAM-dependent methyltransferase
MPYGPQQWDERFAPGAEAYGREPSRYLEEKRHLLRPGQLALVPADGGGRNGVWLARQGLRVRSVDFSPAGLARAREFASSSGVPLETELADLLAWTWPRDTYDLVAAIYFHLPSAHRPRIHRAMLDALRPGGHVLIEAFHVDQLAYASGGPRDADLLMTEERLRSDFEAGDILECRQDRVVLDESRLHRGPAALMRLLVRKP